MLRKVQQRILQTVEIDYFNSADHDTILTNVAANLEMTPVRLFRSL